ncbi:MAG: hypothetical protein KatS3mg087_1000 [Patescibacteria group bacterium]|nr:MAG: hypothetical protein KatS3mg087_1000 [Patescibacteria group bacterium]
MATSTEIIPTTFRVARIAANYGRAFFDEVQLHYEKLEIDKVRAMYNARGSDAASAQMGFSNQALLSDGLLAYWKMDESSGDVTDYSGNGITISNNNSTAYVGGKFGNGTEYVPASSNYFSLNGGGTNTYYFDVSDAGPVDFLSQWLSDANAFDGNTSTFASTQSNNTMQGEGTNAPGTGGAISSVRFRIYGSVSLDVANGDEYISANAYNNNFAENLGTATYTGTTPGYSSYATLSTPSGGVGHGQKFRR